MLEWPGQACHAGEEDRPPAVPCWEWGQSRVRVAGPASGAWPWAPRLSLRMCFSSSAPLSLRAWSTVASHMSKLCHPLGVHTGRHPRPRFPAAGGRCLDGRDHSKSQSDAPRGPVLAEPHSPVTAGEALRPHQADVPLPASGQLRGWPWPRGRGTCSQPGGGRQGPRGPPAL